MSECLDFHMDFELDFDRPYSIFQLQFRIPQFSFGFWLGFRLSQHVRMPWLSIEFWLPSSAEATAERPTQLASRSASDAPWAPGSERVRVQKPPVWSSSRRNYRMASRAGSSRLPPPSTLSCCKRRAHGASKAQSPEVALRRQTSESTESESIRNFLTLQ